MAPRHRVLRLGRRSPRDPGRAAKCVHKRWHHAGWPWGYPGSLYNGAYNSKSRTSGSTTDYNYGFPGGTPASYRITWWLSPPGRFWRGWNQNGIEIAGNVLEWTSDQEYNFAWNMSFENHEGTMNDGGDWRTPNDRSDVPNGYYALGARCAYP